MRIIVAGAGSAARALLSRLGDRCEIVVIDSDRVRLAAAASLVRPIDAIIGDPASQETLDRAGLRDATCVVAMAGGDEENIAISRLSVEAGIPCVAAAVDPERLGDYREAGIPAVSPDALVARRLVSILEPRRVFSAGFASGLAEGLEFEVDARAPVCGRPLRDLDLPRWLVVSILRDGRLIVPHGESVLQPGDLVTVVGSGADRAQVVRSFTPGVTRFPLDFGQRVAVALDSETDLAGPVAEAIHLAQATHADGITFVHRAPQRRPGPGDLVDRATEMAGPTPVWTHKVDGDPLRMLLHTPWGRSVGVVVVPAGSLRSSWWRVPFGRLASAVVRRGTPVLLSRSTFPYRSIVAPARLTRAGAAAARVAVDIAAFERCPVLGVSVVPPRYAASDEDYEQALVATARLQEDAAARGVDLIRAVRVGNAVREIQAESGRESLVVLGIGRRRRTVLTPGIAGHVAHRAPCSVIIVPGDP
jgi:Trk K+ transport system NAD-binding subunit/nucleotide-binding universal stress UspA family protein